MQEYNIILLGETGSGKSTFINYLANYFYGTKVDAQKKFDEIKIAIPNKVLKANLNIAKHSEHNINDPSISQTTRCTFYPFKADGATFKFLDTPGFGDTREGQDEKNLSNILTNIQSIDKISAIILIINGTVARTTSNLSHVITCIRGNLPDSLIRNIIVVFTNSDENSLNFNIKVLGFRVKEENTFLMQNNAFSSNDVNRSDKAWKKLGSDWDDSMDVLGRLISVIRTFDEVSSEDFNLLRIKRQELAVNLNNIVKVQQELLSLNENLASLNTEIKSQQDIMEQNKEFCVNKDIEYNEKISKSYHSTVCKKCYHEYKVCHENCELVFKGEGIKDKNHFKHCSCCGLNEKCGECNCPLKDHYHTRELLQKRTKIVKEILTDKKTKYDVASKGLVDYTENKKKVEEEKMNVAKKVDEYLKKLDNISWELRDICSSFNLSDEMKNNANILRMKAKSEAKLDEKKKLNSTADAYDKLANEQIIQQNKGVQKKPLGDINRNRKVTNKDFRLSSKIENDDEKQVTEPNSKNSSKNRRVLQNDFDSSLSIKSETDDLYKEKGHRPNKKNFINRPARNDENSETSSQYKQNLSSIDVTSNEEDMEQTPKKKHRNRIIKKEDVSEC